MKFNFFLLLLALYLRDTFQAVPGKYFVTYFNQKVDHYNYNHDETFKQRIVMSEKYQNEENPPIFFYCGNEGNIFSFVNNTGLMWEIEDVFKAVIIFVEHRYYGESFPKQKSKSDYSYLSIEQALTDFALILDDLRNGKPNFAKSPVIAFGGSYGGMLAGWMRIKYPHIIEGAIASSAPILQFPGDYDCAAYSKVVTKDYESYSSTCANVIRKSWPAMRRLASTSGGITFLNQAFQLCKPINSSIEVTNLINYWKEIIINVAMTDYPNPSCFLKPLPRYPMKEICKILNKDQLDDTDLVNLFKDGFYSIYFNYTGNGPECINLDQDSTDLGADGWQYQTCTETVMPICSNGRSDFFEPDEFDITQIANDCKGNFGVQLDPNKVRMEYGLKDLRAASNVVFSNGDRDPWAPGGVLIENYKKFGLQKLKGKKLKETIVDYFGNVTNNLDNFIFTTTGSIIVSIPNACHHEDLRAAGKYDPEILIEVRKQEMKIIQKWIKDYYKTFHS